MLNWISRQIVAILCIVAFLSPLIAMSLIEFYYYSTLIGWIVGFICIVIAYIIVHMRPDEEELAS
ncbi:hypothetical protein [Metabacillus fastidiosus]|uniref:hypothetical protein n=1 Tax=Metabacillus fastidiosus TaxID=1458 RepID=UPI003D2DF314